LIGDGSSYVHLAAPAVWPEIKDETDNNEKIRNATWRSKLYLNFKNRVSKIL
jgi:hypothetical protein